MFFALTLTRFNFAKPKFLLTMILVRQESEARTNICNVTLCHALAVGNEPPLLKIQSGNKLWQLQDHKRVVQVVL